MAENLSGWTYALRPTVLRRNAVIALAVGAALSAANQAGVLLRGPWTPELAARIAFNFAIPFVVSSVSAVTNRCREHGG